MKNALPKSPRELIEILSPDRSLERPFGLQNKRISNKEGEHCNKCKIEAALSLSSFGSSDEEQDDVGELPDNLANLEEIKSKKDKDRRASTQVFSLRKVNRMNEFYKYDELKNY